MGFSRQEYWSGLPFSSPGDLPNPGIQLVYLMSNLPWQAGSLPLVPHGKPMVAPCKNLKIFLWISSLLNTYFIAVQLLGLVRLPVTPWTTVHKASLSVTISWNLLKFMSIGSVMLSNYFIIFCSLLLLPSSFLSIRDFSKELALSIRWPKY